MLWITWALDGPHEALDEQLGLRRARAAVLLLLALPGSTYLYQGEELGLPEVWDLDPTVLDDPVWTMSGHTLKGRDGCRVPIPWTTEPPSFGFGTAEPWLPQPAAFADFAVSAQEDDPASTLNLYRTALRLRREHLPDRRRAHLERIARHGGLPRPVQRPALHREHRAGPDRSARRARSCWCSVDQADPALLPGNSAAWLLDAAPGRRP